MMDRRIIAGFAVVVIVAAGVGLILFLPQQQTQFNFDRRYFGEDIVYFQLFLIEDCTVTITFQNTSDSLYEIDLELYQPGVEGTDFTLSYDSGSDLFKLNWGMSGPVRMRTLNIVLGSQAAYYILVQDSYNLDTRITYSNGAILGEDLEYSANGTLSVNLDEGVNFLDGDGNHVVDILRIHPDNEIPSTISLDIDVPVGLGGFLDLGSASVSFTENVGWVPAGPTTWDTESSDYSGPRFTVRMLDGQVTARLID